MKPKARVCSVGMFDNKIEIQLETLSSIFSKHGIDFLKTTYKKSKFFKFIDIFTFLLINKNRYDVIHVQAHSNYNIVSVLISVFWAKILKKKIIVMYYGGAAREFFKSYPKLIKFTFSYVDEIIVAGNYVKSAFDQLNINTKIIPHILEIKKWKYRQRKDRGHNLLWVRHLRKEYNPMMILEVYNKLRKDHKNIELKIIGSGPLKNEMNSYIKDNNLNGVNLLGNVSEIQLVDAYNWADIFINTTNVDNQPVTVLEALASGVPVVSTNVGGIPDIITSGNTGLLSRPGDVEAMVNNIKNIMSDESLIKKLSFEGRNFIEQTFNEVTIYEDWTSIYYKIGYRIK